MEKYLKLKGKKVYYTDVGEGEVIVFLHGWMASKSVYTEIVNILSKKYRCINIDIPGFGNSSLLGKVSVRNMPILIHRIIKEMKIGNFYLVGNSFGGTISLLYADRFPKKIMKVVLISPFVSFKQVTKLAYFGARYIIPYVINKQIIIPIYKFFKFIVNFSENEKNVLQTIKKLRQEKTKQKAINAFRLAYELSSIDLYSVLQRVRKDTLFIYGKRDSLLKITPLLPIFTIVNKLHLIVFEDVRHFLYTFSARELSEKIDLFFNSDNVQ